VFGVWCLVFGVWVGSGAQLKIEPNIDPNQTLRVMKVKMDTEIKPSSPQVFQPPDS